MKKLGIFAITVALILASSMLFVGCGNRNNVTAPTNASVTNVNADATPPVTHASVTFTTVATVEEGVTRRYEIRVGTGTYARFAIIERAALGTVPATGVVTVNLQTITGWHNAAMNLENGNRGTAAALPAATATTADVVAIRAIHQTGTGESLERTASSETTATGTWNRRP